MAAALAKSILNISGLREVKRERAEGGTNAAVMCCLRISSLSESTRLIRSSAV